MKIAVVHKFAAVNHRSHRDIQPRAEHEDPSAPPRVAEIGVFSDHGVAVDNRIGICAPAFTVTPLMITLSRTTAPFST